MTIPTALTKRLGLRYPVIAAPLGRGATPQFLAALAREGSMGFVALMHMPETEVRQMLSGYIAATGGGDRFGVNLTLINDQTRRLDAALEAGCRIVSLWQGDPTRYARRAKDAGAVVFWTVSGPRDAARAADIGVDFIVAQGREAGGHLIGEAPLMSLLPAVVDAAGSVPTIAAGGIADGRGLAAALALGACGVWMGTRFVASVESGNHPGYKQRIANADFADLVETTLFDGGWPESPHRVTTQRSRAGKRQAVRHLALGRARASRSAPFPKEHQCYAITPPRLGTRWMETGRLDRITPVLRPRWFAAWSRSPRSSRALRPMRRRRSSESCLHNLNASQQT